MLNSFNLHTMSMFLCIKVIYLLQSPLSTLASRIELYGELFSSTGTEFGRAASIDFIFRLAMEDQQTFHGHAEGFLSDNSTVEEVCEELQPEDVAVLVEDVPDWRTLSGRLEHFFHPETICFTISLILTCVFCLNFTKIWCFITGARKASKQSMSDLEQTKLIISETSADIAVFSLVMTSVNPLVRALRKKWVLYSPFFAINEFFGLRFHERVMAQNAGWDYDHKDLHSAGDLSWVGHAFFALLWVIFGYLAIRTGAQKSTRAHRKIFSKIAMVSLLCHFGFSCFTLYTDVAKHTLLNKLALLGSWNPVFLHGAIAIAVLFEKRLTRDQRITHHVKHMFMGYITSIQGSGQIRLVSNIYYILGRNVTHYCKNHEYIFSDSDCSWQYFERMFWVSCVTVLYLGLYSWRNPRDSVTRQELWETIPTCIAEYMILKVAEYWDAQQVLVCYFCIINSHRLFKTVEIALYGVDLNKLEGQSEFKKIEFEEENALSDSFQNPDDTQEWMEATKRLPLVDDLSLSSTTQGDDVKTPRVLTLALKERSSLRRWASKKVSSWQTASRSLRLVQKYSAKRVGTSLRHALKNPYN